MCWDISIVSTFKEIIAEINSIKEPVGIILFGADSEFKRQVLKKFADNLSKFTEIGYAGPDSIKLENGLYCVIGKNVLTSLSGDYSANHAERHKAVETIKRIGTKKVIGVYVKQKLIELNLQPMPDYVKRFNWQVDALAKNPPTIDGLNNLIIVSES